MKRAYKGKSEPNISRCREMLCTHTKVYIFPLKNNYSPSRPFVSGRFDKARGTIHHYEWKETLWIFSALYFSIFSHSQRCWIFGFETVVICSLWFMILWAWKTNLSSMCKYFTAGKKKKKDSALWCCYIQSSAALHHIFTAVIISLMIAIILRKQTSLKGRSKATNTSMSLISHSTLSSLEWNLECLPLHLPVFGKQTLLGTLKIVPTSKITTCWTFHNG